MLNFEEHQASVPQQLGNIYGCLVLCKVGFSPSYGGLTEFRKLQSTVSQHSGNNYGNLVSERFFPSFTEFRIITSFCITALGYYLRQFGFVLSFFPSCAEFRTKSSFFTTASGKYLRKSGCMHSFPRLVLNLE